MTKIDGDYLVTDEASVKVLFRKQNGTGKLGVDEQFQYVFCVLTCDALVDDSEVLIPRALVLEAVGSVDGAGEFYFVKVYMPYELEWADSDAPEYSAAPMTHQNTDYYYVADNAITTGKTTGELRELVEWAGGEM